MQWKIYQAEITETCTHIDANELPTPVPVSDLVQYGFYIGETEPVNPPDPETQKWPCMEGEDNATLPASITTTESGLVVGKVFVLGPVPPIMPPKP